MSSGEESPLIIDEDAHDPADDNEPDYKKMYFKLYGNHIIFTTIFVKI